MLKNLIFLVFLTKLASTDYNPYFVDYTPYTYPDSMTQSHLCHPSGEYDIGGPFCDPNNVVHRGESNVSTTNLDFYLNLATSLNINCSCPSAEMCAGNSKYIISVAVVEKMHLDDNESSRDEILQAAKIFADTLRDRQNRGRCDDDILIFLSVRDEVVWTSVGEFVKLNPNDVKRISEHGQVFFKSMRYENGLIWMVKQYTNLLKGREVEKLWTWPIPEWAALGLLIMCLLIIAVLICSIILICIKSCRKSRKAEYSVVDQH